jgi:hypothetical protein
MSGAIPLLSHACFHGVDREDFTFFIPKIPSAANFWKCLSYLAFSLGLALDFHVHESLENHFKGECF